MYNDIQHPKSRAYECGDNFRLVPRTVTQAGKHKGAKKIEQCARRLKYGIIGHRHGGNAFAAD